MNKAKPAPSTYSFGYCADCRRPRALRTTKARPKDALCLACLRIAALERRRRPATDAPAP